MVEENGEIGAIMRRLLAIKAQQDILAAEETVLWDTFYARADVEAGAGKAYRYLDRSNGLVIARQVAATETVNEKALEDNLSRQQWLAVTVAARRLDPTLLEAEMKRGHISSAVVEGVTSRKQTVRRYGPRRASKEELAELAAEEERNDQEAVSTA